MSLSPFMTPDAGPVRTRIERRSALVIVWLAHLPRIIPPLVMVLVFGGGLLLPGVVGAVLLLVTAAVLGLLSYLAWPSVPAPLRLVRLVILAGVVAFAVYKLT
ncbi:MAG: hypothetical protein QOI76_2536 [Frankiales bacterium]|nr:hypothetical protein [Frankiales bacterium]